jgi:Flp pilus assembly protein TadD
MNKFKIFTIALVISATYLQAQDLAPAKKAIDAEQFEKAKSLLKSFIAAKPTNGEAPFLLGKIYLYQTYADSAKVSFLNGFNAKEYSHYNYIGLAQMDLESNNSAGANTNIDAAIKGIKKKDVQEYVYIARAYMDNSKPDYKSAIAILEKAKAINYQDPQVQLALGDAYYGDRNQNDAYSAYRNAFATDPNLVRAKMQLGVILKGASAFAEAERDLNIVANSSPNYGPVYRELAETYYKWGNKDAKNYADYTKKALGYYEKYMSLTDYSLNSRMRHADFLILAKDYVALEAEANKMKEIGGVNPRILRYLGYSSYQNGNTDVAIKSLEDFIANPITKKIPRDYFVLGQAKMKKATGADGKIADQAKFTDAVATMKMAIEQEPKIAEEIYEIGSVFFKQKSYDQAATVFEIATSNKESKNYSDDNAYYGYSVYYGYDKTKPNVAALDKAEIAFSEVIAKYPTAAIYHFFKAKINDLQEKDDAMVKSYQDYMDLVTAKGPDEVAKAKTKFIEAYNNIGAFYANTDKVKATEMWNKTLALDPTNQYAIDSIASLNAVKSPTPTPKPPTPPVKKK